MLWSLGFIFLYKEPHIRTKNDSLFGSDSSEDLDQFKALNPRTWLA